MKNKTILVIVAHPDDEVLGCGGLIKKLSNSGSEIEIIFLSDGESSRDMNDSSKAVKARKSSAHEAARILGVSRIHFCDFEDNAMDKSSLLEIICSVEKILLNFSSFASSIFTEDMYETKINFDVDNF